MERVKNDINTEENYFKLNQFRNINGEGVCAVIDAQRLAEPLRVLCGNEKLMERYNIDLDFNNFKMNM